MTATGKLALLLPIVATGCHDREAPPDDRTVPAEEVRQAVSGLSPSEIARIELRGPLIRGSETAVDDPSEVAAMVSALRSAVLPYVGVRNRTHSLTIVLKKDGQQLGPYNFEPQDPIHCFGQEFHQVLRDLDLLHERHAH